LVNAFFNDLLNFPQIQPGTSMSASAYALLIANKSIACRSSGVDSDLYASGFPRLANQGGRFQ
jgi:hypothetical protein